MTIKVELVTDEGMRKRLQGALGAVESATDSTAVAVEDLVEAGAGKHAKTGALERSIFKQRTQGGWEIGHDLQVAKHARFVHDGTRPHVILPSKRKTLRWPVAGGFAFAGRVNHPGYAGDAWLDRAARQAPDIFKRQVEAQLNGVRP